MRYKHSGEAPPEPGWTWRRSGIVGLGGGMVIGASAAIYFLSGVGMGENEKPATDVQAGTWEPPVVAYNPPTPTTPQDDNLPALDPLPPDDPPTAGQPPQPPPVNEALEAARKGSFGTYEPKGTQLADLGGSGTGCRLPAGTKIHAEHELATTSTNASVVTARVSYDVLGDGGCLAISAGAMMVGNSQVGAEFGASRSNFAYHTIEDNGRAISLEAAAADAMGKGGVPGDVDHHTGMIATRVAIATFTGILDSAASSLVGWGGVPMRETSRSVDKWADQAIDLDPTLETDPSTRRVPIMIVLQKAVVL